MSNIHAANSQSMETGHEEFAEILAQISTWRDETNTIQWEQVIEQYPQFADQLRQVKPAFDGIMKLGESSTRDASNTGSALHDEYHATRSLGDFKIMREIGRGGMGVVYEAQQLSINRRVALKVLPLAALIDSRTLQRFKNEVSAIATLDHPNIVSVYSVGEERAIHFFAMQLVQGPSLSTVIDQIKKDSNLKRSISADSFNQVVTGLNELPNAEDSISSSENHSLKQPSTKPEKMETRAQANSETARVDKSYLDTVIRLIIQVTRALQHTHFHEVIHRDIKPGNLLLDKSGTLYVSDFGLAHIQSGPGVTMTGDFLGTLRYMSPEQILANRVPVDHRTDIYSLGATLYELLALEPMWKGEDRAELIRKISFEEPKLLCKTIPADLQTIVLKATRRDLKERYYSAQEMGDDLQRFLDCKPIVAKRPTIPQRMYKWSCRNPAVISSAILLLFFATVASTISAGLIWQANRRSRTALESEKIATQSAEQQASESKTVVDFLIKDMLAAAGPDVAMGRDLTVKEVLANAEKKLEGRFDDYPAVEASVRHAMGNTHFGLGDYPTAVRHLNRTNQIRTRLYGFEHPDTLLSSRDEAKVMNKQGRFDESRLLYEKILSAQIEVLGEEDPETLRTNSEQTGYLARIGSIPGGTYEKQVEQYRQTLEEILAKQRRLLTPNDIETLRTLDRLAQVTSNLGRWEEAGVLFGDLVQAYDRTLGPDNPLTLKAREHFTVCLRSSGKAEEAKQLYDELLKPFQRVYGPEHPETLNFMQNAAYAEPDLLEKQHSFEELLEIRRRVDSENPMTLRCWGALGENLQNQGKLNEAKGVFQELIQFVLETKGKHTTISIICVQLLGDIATEQELPTEALKFYLEALDGHRVLLGPTHRITRQIWSKLIRTYAILDRKEEGGTLLREYLQILNDRANKPGAAENEFHQVAYALLTDAFPYKDQHDPKAALDLAQRACRYLKQARTLTAGFFSTRLPSLCIKPATMQKPSKPKSGQFH